MEKVCRHCQGQFTVTDTDLSFYKAVSPSFGGQELLIPSPQLCPPCRERRRMSFRNDRNLYARKSSLSGKPILSIYSPDKPYQVYDHDEWWGDGWDPLQYGLDFDFTRSFTEQFSELQRAVPRMNLYVDSTCENCEYSNQITLSKNCYLVYSGSGNQDSYYGYRFMKAKSCVDGFMINESELCYECIDANGCYNCQFSQSIMHCRDSAFLFDCQNCSDCFFCTNLRNKSYCIFNKQYTKEEYKVERQKWDLASAEVVKELKTKFSKMLIETPHLFAHLKQVENVSGDNIMHANDCVAVFNGSNLDKVSYSRFIQDSQNCQDVNFGCDQTILNYEVCTTGVNAYNIQFCCDTWPNVSNLLYCDSCANGTKDCFGCIGLKNKQYCVFNKQYTREQYEPLVAKIIAHMQTTNEWGEFFHPGLAPVGYNESLAAEYYPLSLGEVKVLGYQWSDFQAAQPEAQTVLLAADLPDHIAHVTDAILNSVIKSESSGQLFRITKQELAFCRQNQLPLPRRHPSERHQERLQRRGALNLIKRPCTSCGVAVSTVYTPELARNVHCESCYHKLVY